MRTFESYAWLPLLVLVTACATGAPATRSISETEADLPQEIHWVRNSAEYRALFEQTYRLAGEAIARRATDREPGSWAVVVDADETLISNSLLSKEQALAAEVVSFEDAWDEWVNRRAAPALPGARKFLEQVHALGGRIAVVTNRDVRHCDATEDNLRSLGLPFDVALCRAETSDKTRRWQMVENGTTEAGLPPLEILMWIGDNIHDFPGQDQELRSAGREEYSKFGEVFFALPNPLYGSWEENARE